MQLEQLLYVSSATRELSDAELAGILESSVRNNDREGLTGLLLYSAGSFMQALEGEISAVEATYARILRDPRHHGSIVLHRENIQAREFPNWSMAFKILNREDAILHPRHASLFEHGFQAHVLSSRPGIATELMREFARQSR